MHEKRNLGFGKSGSNRREGRHISVVMRLNCGCCDLQSAPISMSLELATGSLRGLAPSTSWVAARDKEICVPNPFTDTAD